MRSKILALFFAISMVIRSSDAQCSTFIRNYFECKHLKMKYINLTDLLLGDKQLSAYVADSSIPGNSLNESFFERQLDHLNFDKAMNLFQTIFNETYECSSEFCKCVNSGILQTNNGYGKIFRNRNLFSQFKRILVEFDQKFPQDEIDMFIRVFKPSSVLKFCLRYDYSISKTKYHAQTRTCMVPKTNFIQSTMECSWKLYQSAHLKWILQGNMSVLTESEQRHFVTCAATTFSSIGLCQVEQKRLFAVSLLALFSEDALSRIDDLKAYSDNLIATVVSYEPKFKFHETSVMLPFWNDEPKLRVDALDSEVNYCPIARNGEAVLFSSPEVNVSVEWSTDVLEKPVFKSLNVSLKYNERLMFRRSFDLYPDGLPIFESWIRDPKEPFDKVWIRIIDQNSDYLKSLYIYDFKNNVKIVANLATVTLSGPSILMMDGTGLLIESCTSNDTTAEDMSNLLE